MKATLVTLSFAALAAAHKQISDLIEEPQLSEGIQEVVETVAIKKDFNWFIMTY